MFSGMEIINMVLVIVIVGYIFSDIFGKFAERTKDPLDFAVQWFDFEGFKFSIMVTAPAIILHELAHKFMAMFLGYQGVFEAAYGWLAAGVFMRLANFGFVFFTPAYVKVTGAATHLDYALIALAGPLTNLVLWLVFEFILRKNLVNSKYISLIGITARINMFLFIFNMVPIPGFDGSHILSGFYNVLFG